MFFVYVCVYVYVYAYVCVCVWWGLNNDDNNDRTRYFILVYIVYVLGIRKEGILRATKTQIDWFYVVLYVFNYVWYAINESVC